MPMTFEGFYFEPMTAVLKAGARVYCLDRYQVKLETPVRRENGVWTMSERDLKGLLSVLPARPELPGEMMPLEELLPSLGCACMVKGEYLMVLLREGAEFPDEGTCGEDLERPEMTMGDHYATYWHEELQRWAPYRLYMPERLVNASKRPLLVGLHGGGGSPDSIFRNSGDRIKEYADRDGYLLLAPDGVTKNSTYGCALPPYGMPGAVADPSCPENPQHLTERELHWIHMGETGLAQLIGEICVRFDVDPDQRYLMGNSMGGIGTLHFASRYPEMFRKISPAGAAPDMRVFDCSGLLGIPQFYVAGELDSHGVKWLAEAASMMREQGVPVVYREVAGGTHGSAWIDVIDEIFDFFRG